MGIKVQGQVRLRRVQVHQPGILHPTTFLKTQMGLTCPLVVLRYARMSNVEGFYTNQGYRPVSRDWVETKVLGLERNCFQAHIRKPH